MLIALVSIGLRFVSCPPLFVFIPYWYDLVGYRLISKLAYRFIFHWSPACVLSAVTCYISYWCHLVGYYLIRKHAHSLVFHLSLVCELSEVVYLHFLLVSLVG